MHVWVSRVLLPGGASRKTARKTIDELIFSFGCDTRDGTGTKRHARKSVKLVRFVFAAAAHALSGFICRKMLITCSH